MSDTETKEYPGTSKQRANGFPIVIAEWPHHNSELIRISLGYFNDRFTIDIRTWWRAAEGIFKPSKSGLTLAVKHLPALVKGITEALHRARDLGLIEAGNYAKETTASERQRRKRHQ